MSGAASPPAPGPSGGGIPARLAHLGVRVVLIALGLATALFLGAWALVSRDPPWWPAPTAATASDAEAVERAISDQIMRRRSNGTPWSIDVTEDAANAWLAHRLPLWMAHEGVEWPWPGCRVAARFSDGIVRFGVERPDHDLPRVIGVSFAPSVPEPGRVTVRLDSAHLGGLRAGGALARLATRWMVDADRAGDAASAALDRRTVRLPPIPLDDGRSVVVEGITPAPGRLRLTFRAAEEGPPRRAYHADEMTDASTPASGPRTILFVCTGNTCRSPMAEAIARRVLEHDGIPASRARIRSAGAHATDGTPAAPEAIRAVARLGGDLTRFRSHELTPRMLSEADIILAMSASHVASIVAMDPSAADRVYMLDPTGADIPDPLGASQEVYDQTAARLMTLIHRRLADLLGDVPDQTTGAAP